MCLAWVGTLASYVFGWRRGALLGDVVVPHLDAREGDRFEHFVSIGPALGVESMKIRGAALGAVLRLIRGALGKRPVDDLVLGPITARVLYPNVNLEAPRPMTKTELSQLVPVGEAKTLAEYFSSMLDSMLEVCEHPTPDGTIEVHDG
jgi:hypothetical protein